MIDFSKVIFCIGSAQKKRAHFRQAVKNGVVFADSDEVLAGFPENGRTFFVIGDYPFKDMGAYEFVRYNRMIISGNAPSKREVAAFLRQATGKRVNLRKKLGSLSLFGYRAVSLISRCTEKTERVAVSFDGLTYSPSKKRAMLRLIAALNKYEEVLISVSDSRFIPCGATVRRFDSSGAVTELSLKSESRSFYGKRLIKAYAKRRNIASLGKIRQIVVSV